MKKKTTFRIKTTSIRRWKRFLKAKKRRKKKDRDKTRNKKHIKIKCPSIFSVLESPNDTITFFKNLRDSVSLKTETLKINLSQVKHIDNLSIMMLLSNINHIAKQGVHIKGNMPKNEDARLIFEHSGFLRHVKCINKQMRTISKNDGLIVDMGKDTFNSINADSVILDILQKMSLRNDTTLYQSLNGIVGEMGGNTIQYAYDDKKDYLFGAFPNKEYTSFIFADSGFGILNTLKKSFTQMIVDLLKQKGAEDVLYGAFIQKYGSNTGEKNRNRGLPYILRTYKDGTIQNLLVITNNVILNFANRRQSLLLKESYDGTVYYWQISNKHE